jgi:hypothetical protein
MLILLFGLGWFLRSAGLWVMPWQALFAGLLVFLGLSLMVTAFRPGRGGLVLLGVVMTIGLFAGSASLPDWFHRADAVFRPTEPGQLVRGFHGSFGNLKLDLGDYPFGQSERTLVNNGVGDITVLVPHGIGVRLETHKGPGDVTLFGEHVSSGFMSDGSHDSPGYRDAAQKLTLVVNGGVGDVTVRESAQR